MVHFAGAIVGGPIASLPLEGRDRGWGSISGPPDHPLPSLARLAAKLRYPPRKGEGGKVRNVCDGLFQ